MTDEQMRIAIAKRCGWTFCDRVTDKKTGVSWDVYHKEGRRASIKTDSIPNYPNDLNAMHEAEKVLKEPFQITEYGVKLALVMKLPDINGQIKWGSIVMATASQRAKAFLRTTGDWKD